MDIVSIDLREENNEAVSREKVENLVHQFAAIQQSEKVAVQNGEKAEVHGLAGLEGRDLTPMFVTVPILIRRSLLRFKRQPDLAVARIMQVVGLGFFIALFFAPLKTDYFSFQNRLGAIQQTLSGKLLSFQRVIDAYLRISVFCGFAAKCWPIPIGTRCVLQGMVAYCCFTSCPFTESSIGICRQDLLCKLVLLRLLDP